MYFLNKFHFAKQGKMRIIASLVGCRAVRYKLDLGLLGKERKMRIGSYQLRNRVLLEIGRAHV